MSIVNSAMQASSQNHDTLCHAGFPQGDAMMGRGSAGYDTSGVPSLTLIVVSLRAKLTRPLHRANGTERNGQTGDTQFVGSLLV